MTTPPAAAPDPESVLEALDAVEQLCGRHEIAALEDFLESCRNFARDQTLNIAVLGRFKAGKSSFLNQLLGRAILPVGAIPVTAVVTEIEWGAREQAEVIFTDGRAEPAPVDSVGEYVSESGNPGNVKGVARVRVMLPSMERYRGIRFVDTPGLESVLEHNTDASREWLPNVGMALVAVGADPPLSRHDIGLIRELGRYTPNIAILLTKVDVLGETERGEVLEFVQQQLARYWRGAVPVFPYSVRPGFESLRAALEAKLLAEVRSGARAQHAAILRHKLDSLLGECAGYLQVALRAAESADSEREQLRRKVLGEQTMIDDTRLALKLIVRHAAANTRPAFEALLRGDELPLRNKLQEELGRQFPAWTRSLGSAAEGFDGWLRDALKRAMAELSARRRQQFLEPLEKAGRQLSQTLQDFRNRLSDRVLEALGVPLKTTQMELRAAEPSSPDVRIGKIFDHNWELISWLIPMPLVRGMLFRHFQGKIELLVFTNLSRLASQWEEVVNSALLALEKESLRRLDGLVGTIGKLIASAGRQAPAIGQDLLRIEELRRRLNGNGG